VAYKVKEICIVSQFQSTTIFTYFLVLIAIMSGLLSLYMYRSKFSAVSNVDVTRQLWHVSGSIMCSVAMLFWSEAEKFLETWQHKTLKLTILEESMTGEPSKFLTTVLNSDDTPGL